MTHDLTPEASNGDDSPRADIEVRSIDDLVNLLSWQVSDDGNVVQTGNWPDYSQIVHLVVDTEATAADREKLADLLHEGVRQEDVQQAADQIERETPFKRLAHEIREADRKHPPGWAAWVAGILIPVVMPFSGLFGQNAPQPVLPRAVPVIIPAREYDDPPAVPPPTAELLRSILNQVSPEALQGLSPQERIELTERVSSELHAVIAPFTVTLVSDPQVPSGQ